MIFTTDLSGVRLPIGLARTVKPLKSSRGIPDLIVLQPSGVYHGLMIEFKTPESNPYRRDGKLHASQRTGEQAAIITRLREKGYAAFFVCSLEDGIDLVRAYTDLKDAGATLPPGNDIEPLVYRKSLKTL